MEDLMDNCIIESVRFPGYFLDVHGGKTAVRIDTYSDKAARFRILAPDARDYYV